MTFHELETVVLTRDMPEAGLRAGDPGAIVQVYTPDAVEVEFVTASGKTLAPQTLTADDVRTVRDDDLLAGRTAVRGAAQAVITTQTHPSSRAPEPPVRGFRLARQRVRCKLRSAAGSRDLALLRPIGRTSTSGGGGWR